MDNATGVAVLLETARVLVDAKIEYSIVFVLFGGEECIDGGCTGSLQGSWDYVSEMTNEEKESIFGMINIDLVGKDGSIQLRREADLSSLLAEDMMIAFEQQGLTTTFFESKDWSDHASFEEVDIPSVFIYTPSCCFEHTPEDTMEKVSFKRVEEITKGVVWYLVNDTMVQ